jgi:hypothetical protein
MASDSLTCEPSGSIKRGVWPRGLSSRNSGERVSRTPPIRRKRRGSKAMPFSCKASKARQLGIDPFT